MKRLLCVILAVFAAVSLAYAPGEAATADDTKYWSLPLASFEAGNPTKNYFVGTAELFDAETGKPKKWHYWFTVHPKQAVVVEGAVSLSYYWLPANEVKITESSKNRREVNCYGESPWYRLAVRKGDVAPAEVKSFRPPTTQPFPHKVKAFSGTTGPEGLLESGDLARFTAPGSDQWFRAGRANGGYYFFRSFQQKTREQEVAMRMKGIAIFLYRYVPEKGGRSFELYPPITIEEGIEKPWCGSYTLGTPWRLQVPKGSVAPPEVKEILPPRELPGEEKNNRSDQTDQTDPPDTTKK